MSKVRIALIGAGWWAVTNHLPVLRARDDVELVAINDSDGAKSRRVAEEFDIPFTDTELATTFSRELDAVIVSTPNHLHHPTAAAAFDHGLSVLCEKPMALTAADAWDLVARAERAGRHLLVPYGWNYKPFIQEAKRHLQAGELGEIEFALCHMASPTRELFAGSARVPSQWAPTLATPNPSTWQSRAFGGGYAFGQITHSVALLLWLTGLRTREVTALMRAPGAAVDLYAAATVVFESEAVCALSGAATLPADSKYQVDLRIFGTKAVLLLDVERERMEILRHDGSRAVADVPAGEGTYTCEAPVNRFVDLVSGAALSNDSDGVVGARTAELIEALHASAAIGGRATSVWRP